jgi:Protein of unknown function (DUF3987)
VASSHSEDFFSHYLQYTSNAEPPAIFNRWALITGIGAFLGRQYYFEHGHFTLYPNIYAMLIGSSGTRKSSAIKLMRKLLIQAGYTTIAADKSTKEKFLLDLAGEDLDTAIANADDILDQNLFGGINGHEPDREMFIMADEFNDFFGNGNIEFISLLGTLWDYTGIYRNRIKSGKSVNIVNPTVSILGGNTPTNLALAFPPETLGQGFFSRLLLIYGEPNGKRITFPKPPAIEHTEFIIRYFTEIKRTVLSKCDLDQSAERLLDRIYQSNHRIDDVRFESYSNRRFNHLIKLCLVCSASRLSKRITEQDVIYANTILTHAEQFMPKALGQFGRAKNSDVVHKVMQVIDAADKPITLRDIWAHVSSDLEKLSQLTEILINLSEADKIQKVPSVHGFLPKKKVVEHAQEGMVDFSLLTPEERNMRL